MFTNEQLKLITECAFIEKLKVDGAKLLYDKSRKPLAIKIDIDIKFGDYYYKDEYYEKLYVLHETGELALKITRDKRVKITVDSDMARLANKKMCELATKLTYYSQIDLVLRESKDKFKPIDKSLDRLKLAKLALLSPYFNSSYGGYCYDKDNELTGIWFSAGVKGIRRTSEETYDRLVNYLDTTIDDYTTKDFTKLYVVISNQYNCGDVAILHENEYITTGYMFPYGNYYDFKLAIDQVILYHAREAIRYMKDVVNDHREIFGVKIEFDN